MKNKMKLQKQTFKNSIAVLIIGDDRRDTIRNFWSFANRGGVRNAQPRGGDTLDDSGLTWINDYNAYFLTTEKELQETMDSICLFRVLQNVDKNYQLNDIPPDLEDIAKVNAAQWFGEMEESNFVLKN